MNELLKKIVENDAVKKLAFTAVKTVLVCGIVGVTAVVGSNLYIKSYLATISKTLEEMK